MGGLGPGIGGAEYIVIAIVALLVVGPERLPMLLNKLGKLIGKAQRMAGEFRASFDEMARQSELDDLRKEVDALRRGQGMYALGDDAEKAFKDIRDDLNQPVGAAPITPAEVAAETEALPSPMIDEWPDSPPVLEPLEAAPAAKPAPKPRKPRAKKVDASDMAGVAPAKPRAPRKKAVDL